MRRYECVNAVEILYLRHTGLLGEAEEILLEVTFQIHLLPALRNNSSKVLNQASRAFFYNIKYFLNNFLSSAQS